MFSVGDFDAAALQGCPGNTTLFVNVNRRRSAAAIQYQKLFCMVFSCQPSLTQGIRFEMVPPLRMQCRTRSQRGWRMIPLTLFSIFVLVGFLCIVSELSLLVNGTALVAHAHSPNVIRSRQNITPIFVSINWRNFRNSFLSLWRSQIPMKMINPITTIIRIE